MSVPTAMRTLTPKLARHLNVRAEGLRSEIYGVLERNRVGAGSRASPPPVSAEGDPPARDTGRLMESIAVTKRATPSDLLSTVGPRPQAFTGRAYYPFYLEFGTRRGLAARPFMRPSLESFKRKIR